MRAIVIYESMFGNTRRVAEAVARGLARSGEVRLARADEVRPVDLAGADLVVVGAPTHAWGLPRTNTRREAVTTANRGDNDLILEPAAERSPGVREWLHTLDRLGVTGAAFDTRLRAPRFLTGRASTSISRNLRHDGAQLISAPASFFVDRHNHLYAGEEERARAWGERLGVEASRHRGAAVGRASVDWARVRPRTRLDPLERGLVFLEMFVSLCGIGGGIYLVSSPRSAMPLEYLEGTWFDTWRWPGVALLIFVGVGPALAVVATLRRRRVESLAHVLVGLGLVVWIIVEALWVVVAAPLQIAFAAIGVVIAALALVRNTRRRGRPSIEGSIQEDRDGASLGSAARRDAAAPDVSPVGGTGAVRP